MPGVGGGIVTPAGERARPATDRGSSAGTGTVPRPAVAVAPTIVPASVPIATVKIGTSSSLRARAAASGSPPLVDLPSESSTTAADAFPSATESADRRSSADALVQGVADRGAPPIRNAPERFDR